MQRVDMFNLDETNGVEDKIASSLNEVICSIGYDAAFTEDKHLSLNAVQNKAPNDILALFKKSQEHAAAYEASRKKSRGLEGLGGSSGVASATLGTLLYTGVLTMSVLPVTAVAVGCVAGIGFFAGGVKSLDSKQGQLAAHETSLVTSILRNLLEEGNYKDFTRSVLLIIREVAKKRSTNGDRDIFLTTVIDQLANVRDIGIFQITTNLINLRNNLRIKNSTSITADKIEELIRQLENKMLEEGLYKEVVKINVALIEADIRRRNTKNVYRDQVLTQLSQDVDYATNPEDATTLVIAAKNNLFDNSKTSQAGLALEGLQDKLEKKFGKINLEEQRYQTPGMNGSIQ